MEFLIDGVSRYLQSLTPSMFQPKLSDFREEMCRNLDAVPPRRDEKRRHANTFRKSLMRKRLVQAE